MNRYHYTGGWFLSFSLLTVQVQVQVKQENQHHIEIVRHTQPSSLTAKALCDLKQFLLQVKLFVRNLYDRSRRALVLHEGDVLGSRQE